ARCSSASAAFECPPRLRLESVRAAIDAFAVLLHHEASIERRSAKYRRKAVSRFLVSHRNTSPMIGSRIQRSTAGRAVKWYVYVMRDSCGPTSSWRIDAAHVAKNGGEFTILTAATRGGSNET